MLFLNVAGWISLVFGLLFLFAPKALANLNNTVNKILLDLDSALYRMRIGIGISLCLVSFMVFFTVYYMAHKFGMR